MDVLRRIGKSIPESILARDHEWRRSVADRQGKWVPEFVLQGTPISQCPICQRSDPRPAGLVAQVEYLQCDECGHLFCGISPSAEFLEAYYKADNSAQRKTYLENADGVIDNRQSQIALEKALFVNEVARNFTSGVEQGSPLWVDIGSGVGDLLVSALGLGFDVHGFEPDEAQVQVALNRGVPTTSAYISPREPIPEPIQHADIVSLLNLLEHIAHPVEFVSHLTAGNRTGSFVAIEVPRQPSVSSILQLSGFYQSHRHIYPPEHLQIFSEQSITKLLKFCDYEPRGIWVFGSDALEVFASVRDSYGEGGRFDDEMGRTRVESLQQSVDNHGLSDNMLLVAQKIGSGIP